MLPTENSSVLKYRTPICHCSDHHKLPPPFLKSKMTPKSLLPFPQKNGIQRQKKKYHLHTKQEKKKQKTQSLCIQCYSISLPVCRKQVSHAPDIHCSALCQEPHRHLNHLDVSYRCSQNLTENTTDALEA